MEAQPAHHTRPFAECTLSAANGLRVTIRGNSKKAHPFVMLSAAKHLGTPRARPFAECILSEANGLRVTLRA
jgi:hypothetical protein